MTVRIAKEFGYPIEEVASWPWRKREIYASGLAELNRYDKEMSEKQADEEQESYDTPSVDGANAGGGMGQGDHHPALSEYDNVSKMH